MAGREASTPLLPPVQVPAGSPDVEVVFEIDGGDAVEVRLHDDVLDTFGTRHLLTPRRFRRTVRSALARLFDEVEPLRTRLRESRGRSLQDPLKELLELLGLYVKPIDGAVVKRAGLPEGVGEFDLLAERRDQGCLLAVEGTSGWCGPEKLGRIVARAKELGRLLRPDVAPEELTVVLPALAVNKPRQLAADHLLKSARDYEVGVIALEDMMDLLDMVGLGERPSAISERFADCFPSTAALLLRRAYDDIQVYERWDGG
jgi:hypothetical protein